MRYFLSLSMAAAIVASVAFAQRGGEVSWAPKPQKLTEYTGPHKPHTKIAEVRTKHSGHKDWYEPVVDDEHFTSGYRQIGPGGKISPRFHPDTRHWLIMIDGQMRISIEGQDQFLASKGSIVNVPAQTVYSAEVTGDKPALFYDVDIAKAKTMHPLDQQPAKLPGFDWVKVRLPRKPFGYDAVNKPHTTFTEVAERLEKGQVKGTQTIVKDDRGVANFIYGYEKNLPAINPKDKGHFHPECAEYWLVMAGQIRYPIEGVPNVVIASEGDVVYVPKFRYHAPRWYGTGPSCRLAMNGYPQIAHLFDGSPTGN